MKILLGNAPPGVRIIDKVLINYARMRHISKRIIMRIRIGKKKRDEWVVKTNSSWMNYLTGKRLLIRNEQNLKFWVRVNNNWDFLVVSSENCEPTVLKTFTPNMGDVVIDVGANIGKYAIHSGYLVGKEGKVIALEPSPEPLELLRKSVKENNLENVVTCLQYAASDKNGKMKLYFSDKEPLASLVYQMSNKYIEVETVTLDSLVENLKLKKVDWIKIDAEGAEYEVLSGSIDTLRKNNVNLVVEVLTINKDKVLELLRSIGYSISILESYETEAFTEQGFFNFFAKKR